MPITRGDYVISSFSAYKKFDPPVTAAQRVSIPSHIQSLMPQFLVSEAIALNCANACGILGDFLEDDDLMPTVSGRMTSGFFGFNIETDFGMRYVEVSNSQIEIDAAYEGINYPVSYTHLRNMREQCFLTAAVQNIKRLVASFYRAFQVFLTLYPCACI